MRTDNTRNAKIKGGQIEVFNILNGYENIDSNFFFLIKESKVTRGHNYTLAKTQSRLNVRKYSFSQSGIHYQLIVYMLVVLICFIQCLTVYNVLLLIALVNVTGRLVFSFLYPLSVKDSMDSNPESQRSNHCSAYGCYKKNTESLERSCMWCLWTWKRPTTGCQGN